MKMLKRECHEYEFKSISTEIVDVDVKNGIVTGYFASFNTIDEGRDRIRPGAFAKTIAERGPQSKNQIFHLLNHYSGDVLGKPQVLKEDAKGLYFETKVSQTTLGKDTLVLYADGVYNEHSIGYKAMKWQEIEAENCYDLLEIKLWEGSTVNWGMNEDTPFTGFKSIDQIDFLEKKRNELMKALKVQGLSDDGYTMIELALVQLTDGYKQLIKSLDNNEPEGDSTREKSQPINWDHVQQLSSLL